jgi:hypothetical protein
MHHRFFTGAVAGFVICLAAPRAAQAQAVLTDSAAPAAPVIRPLETVVVTAERPSAFSSAMSRLGLRASIATKQRENRRLARRLAVYDRVAFGLERKLDSLMVVATIHELNIARTDSATAMLRNRRLQLEAALCRTAPAECATGTSIASGGKGN